MRHLKAGRRLGVTTSHRRAMMRNLVTSILEKGQVTCTLARAKEVRKPLEKMITLAKRGDLHSRRHALRFVKTKEAIAQLFNELGNRYEDRQGGYCRVIKLGNTRLGDNADMAIVQLIGSERDQLSSLKKKSMKKKTELKKDSKVLKEITEEVLKAEEMKKKLEEQDALSQGATKNPSGDKLVEEVNFQESDDEIQFEVKKNEVDKTGKVDSANTETQQKAVLVDEIKQETSDESNTVENKDQKPKEYQKMENPSASVTDSETPKDRNLQGLDSTGEKSTGDDRNDNAEEYQDLSEKKEADKS